MFPWYKLMLFSQHVICIRVMHRPRLLGFGSALSRGTVGCRRCERTESTGGRFRSQARARGLWRVSEMTVSREYNVASAVRALRFRPND